MRGDTSVLMYMHIPIYMRLKKVPLTLKTRSIRPVHGLTSIKIRDDHVDSERKKKENY